MRIFDTILRSDEDAAECGEPYWAYLNRSARAEFAAARNRIEQYFARLCPTMHDSVGGRLRSLRDQEFAAGWWELYVHELAVRSGYRVTCEPRMSNGRSIDFLLNRGSEAIYVEATIARKSGADLAADRRRDDLYRRLNRIVLRDFMLGVDIKAAGPGNARGLAALCDELPRWVGSLDVDAIARQMQGSMTLPSLTWADGRGWEVEFEAIPLREGARGVVQEPLGMLSDETGGAIDDETPLRRALTRKKPSRYGELDIPYVIAVCEEPFVGSANDFHRINVFYGHEAIRLGPPHEAVRIDDGYWRGPRGTARNRRVAAVLLASRLMPWTVTPAQLQWWTNPFAKNPVSRELGAPLTSVCDRRDLTFDHDGRGTMVQTPAPSSLESLMGSA